MAGYFWGCFCLEDFASKNKSAGPILIYILILVVLYPSSCYRKVYILEKGVVPWAYHYQLPGNAAQPSSEHQPLASLAQVMEAIRGDIGKEGKGSEKAFKYHFSKSLDFAEQGEL